MLDQKGFLGIAIAFVVLIIGVVTGVYILQSQTHFLSIASTAQQLQTSSPTQPNPVPLSSSSPLLKTPSPSSPDAPEDLTDKSGCITEKDTGKTFTINQHYTADNQAYNQPSYVCIALMSTYWSFDPFPKGSLQPNGKTEVWNPVAYADGSKPSDTITPNELEGCAGCGKGALYQSFYATGPGSYTVTAHRDTCGEALGCPPEFQNFKVTIIVK